MTIHHIEVFYTDPMNGWATATYDAEGYQIGEAEYYFLKEDALSGAVDMAGGTYDIQVFTKAGKLQRTYFDGLL